MRSIARSRDLIDIDEILAADCVDAAGCDAPAIDEHQRIEVAQLDLRSARRVLIVVVCVAVARVAAAGKGRQRTCAAPSSTLELTPARSIRSAPSTLTGTATSVRRRRQVGSG